MMMKPARNACISLETARRGQLLAVLILRHVEVVVPSSHSRTFPLRLEDEKDGNEYGDAGEQYGAQVS